MRVFVLLFLIVLLIDIAFGVTCYECDTVNDKYCGEAFIPDDIAQTDCESLEVPERLLQYYPQRPSTACLTKYYEGLPGEKYFIRRSCYFGNLEDSYYSCEQLPDPLVPYLDFWGCMVCDDDLCNGSLKQRATMALTLGVMGVLLLGV